jgi:SAM-dependent methyltransferase
MLTSSAEHAARSYARVGQEAVRVIEQALKAGADGREPAEPRSILDLGCGHGRVLRYLRERFPGSTITACDLDPEAVAFCSRSLGATPLQGAADFDEIDFASYDLVWMGSLLTHLPHERWQQLARVLGRILEPAGIVVFSTHGEQAQRSLDSYGPGLEARRHEMEEQLAGRGHAYLPYEHYGHDGYGVAFHTDHEIEATMLDALGEGSRRLLLLPAGWGGHQDIHAFQRTR